MWQSVMDIHNFQCFKNNFDCSIILYTVIKLFRCHLVTVAIAHELCCQHTFLEIEYRVVICVCLCSSVILSLCDAKIKHKCSITHSHWSQSMCKAVWHCLINLHPSTASTNTILLDKYYFRHANFKTNQHELTHYFAETRANVNFINMKFPTEQLRLCMISDKQCDYSRCSKCPAPSWTHAHRWGQCLIALSMILWSNFCHSSTRSDLRWHYILYYILELSSD